MDKTRAVQESMSPLILVVGCARSGTSVVAGLLHYHGIWGGRYRPANGNNPRGYFENRRIMALLMKWNDSGEMSLAEFKLGIRKIWRKEKYSGGPWFVKYGLELGWDMWRKFNPYYLLVRRDWESVRQSQERVFGEARPYEEYKSINGTMDVIKQTGEGKNIYPDQIIEGDYSILAGFLKEHTDIAFDENIVNQFIDKELWHAAG